jgi:circadian clock protein KaiB
LFDLERNQLTPLNSPKFEFRLFVSSSRAECRETVSDLQHFLESHLNGQYVLTVVDVVERPDLAKRDGILATPTLVKVAPGPELRMIGSISNR